MAQLRWGWHTLLRLQEMRTFQTVPDHTRELLPLSQWVSSSSQAPYNPRLLPQSLWSGEWEGELGDEKQHPTGPLSLLRPAHSTCFSLAWANHSCPHHWALKIVFIWMPK